jgi:hypothetical protein
MYSRKAQHPIAADALDMVDHTRRIAELRDSGAVTAAEFEAFTSRLLDGWAGQVRLMSATRQWLGNDPS